MWSVIVSIVAALVGSALYSRARRVANSTLQSTQAIIRAPLSAKNQSFMRDSSRKTARSSGSGTACQSPLPVGLQTIDRIESVLAAGLADAARVGGRNVRVDANGMTIVIGADDVVTTSVSGQSRRVRGDDNRSTEMSRNSPAPKAAATRMVTATPERCQSLVPCMPRS
jgi:hypothetical protein